jgi:tetratricopeptide (TPR) repeat protein
MKFVSILILFTTISACSQNTETTKYTPDPKAMQLSDSAVNLAMQSQTNYDVAIALLDQATKIDSNCYLAFGNKLSFQVGLKRYKDALLTAKNLIRIKPENPDGHVMAGGIYWKLEDSVSSIEHFTKAAVFFDKILDTMKTSNKMYETFLLNKAVNLILLGQDQKGDKILKELYNNQKDEVHREMFGMFLNKSKDQILNDLFTTDTDVSDTIPTIKN